MNDNVEQSESTPEILLEKDSRAKRWMKSTFARLRRGETKHAREIQTAKDEKDAKERLKAKRLLEKQKKASKTKKSS